MRLRFAWRVCVLWVEWNEGLSENGLWRWILMDSDWLFGILRENQVGNWALGVLMMREKVSFFVFSTYFIVIGTLNVIRRWVFYLFITKITDNAVKNVVVVHSYYTFYILIFLNFLIMYDDRHITLSKLQISAFYFNKHTGRVPWKKLTFLP